MRIKTANEGFRVLTDSPFDAVKSRSEDTCT